MMSLSAGEVMEWLREERSDRLSQLWRAAQQMRRSVYGSGVHLRGLVEISNRCRRHCTYCALRGPNRRIQRYRMESNAIQRCADQARRLGLRTLVLQSGEAEEADDPKLEAMLRALSGPSASPLHVTLSLGEATEARYARWWDAGASRYLLKFETSDRVLFERIHPARSGDHLDRISLIGVLRRLGYEVGSGIMVGLPGQTWDSVARDLERFRELDLDMIAVGPYVPHPRTPLGRECFGGDAPGDDHVPRSVAATCRVIALARILCPEANIPASTGLSLAAPDGLERGLRAGANVIMINLTPARYQRAYALYPALSVRDPLETHSELRRRMARLGLTPSTGPDGRRRTGGVACISHRPS